MMRLKTFNFNDSFFFRNIRQLKWVIAVNTIILAIMYPLNLYFSSFNDSLELSSKAHALLNFQNTLGFSFPIILFPVIYGLLSFRYLTNKGESIRIHSLPVTRKSLFMAHNYSALIAILLPYCMTTILLFLVKWCLPAEAISYIGIITWFGVSLFFSYTFYSVAVLSSMIIGNLLMQAVFTYIVLLLPTGLLFLIYSNLKLLVLGYVDQLMSGALMYSPLTGFLLIAHRWPLAMVPLWFWLLSIGLSIISITTAYWLYKTKSIENAGETVQIKAMMPFLRTLGIYCIMLLTGLLTKDIFNNNGAVLLGYLIGGILGYVVLEMVIQNSIQCKLSLKVFGLTIGIFSVLIGLVIVDVFGYSTRTMPSDEITSVYFNRFNYCLDEEAKRYTFTDRETIQAVETLYLDTLKSNPKYFWQADALNKTTYSFTFTNKDGKAFTRSLLINTKQAEQALLKIYATNAYKEAKIPFLALNANDVSQLSFYSPLGTYVLTDSQRIQDILNATKKDLEVNPIIMDDLGLKPQYILKASLSTSAPAYPYQGDGIVHNGTDTLINFNVFSHYDNLLSLCQSMPEFTNLLVPTDETNISTNANH